MDEPKVQPYSGHLFKQNEWLVLIVLFLSFMDFYLFSMHLTVLAFALWCFLKGRISLPNGIIPPLLFTISLAIFWEATSISPTILMKRLVWPAAFALGYNIILPRNSNNDLTTAEKKVQVLYFLAALGFFIHVLLNIYINRGMETADRNTLDFWTGARRAATGQAGLICIPMAWCVAYIVQPKKLITKALVIAALALLLNYNLLLGSRTILLELLLLTIIVVLFSAQTRQLDKKKKRGLFLLILGILAIVLAYHYDIGGLRSLVDNSALGERFLGNNRKSFSEDSRWSAKIEYLKRMPDHLFGGSNIKSAVGLFAHDILLDTYDECGVFAFFAVIALLWDAVSKLLHLLRSKLVSYEVKITTLCIYVAILIVFCVEPVFAGLPTLLVAFCFFHGIVSCIVSSANAQLKPHA